MQKIMYRYVGSDEYSEVYDVISVAVEEGVYTIIYADSTVHFLPVAAYEVVVGEQQVWTRVQSKQEFERE